MSYTPINWQTGDTITAGKMNKMDNGWGVQNTQFFSETVTTVAGDYGNEAYLTYSTPITADSITVVFNGNSYTCAAISMTTGTGYGGVDSSWNYDFSEYPFAIVSRGGTNYFATQNAGTYTVSATGDVMEVSDSFKAAVSSSFSSPPPLECIAGETTYDEMVAARQSGRLMYFYVNGICHFVSSFVNDTSPTAVTAVPEGVANVETFGFEEDGDGNLILNVFEY